jgi:ribonuclease-3
MNLTELQDVAHSIEALGKAFRTIVTTAPRLLEIDSNLCDIGDEAASLMVARTIQKSYRLGNSWMIDNLIAAETLSTPLTGDQYHQFVISSIKKPRKKTRRPHKPWPPNLPQFSDKKLEAQALTHKSFAIEKYRELTEAELLTKHNARLEFFGDALLNFLICSIVCHRFPDSTQGHLTHMKSHLVSNETLWDLATMYGLDKNLHTNFSLIAESEGKKSKLIADTMEAYIGGLYLDPEQGPQAVEKWITDLVDPLIHQFGKQLRSSEYIDKDAKSKLYLSIGGSELIPEYVTVIEGDSVTPFTVECCVGHDVIGVGTDANIKTAGIRAAMMALGNHRAITQYSDIRRHPGKAGMIAQSVGQRRAVPTVPAEMSAKAHLYAIIGSSEQTPLYRTVATEGLFGSCVSISKDLLGTGTGRSKKEAEQAAAEDALKNKPMLAKWELPKKKK